MTNIKNCDNMNSNISGNLWTEKEGIHVYIYNWKNQ